MRRVCLEAVSPPESRAQSRRARPWLFGGLALVGLAATLGVGWCGSEHEPTKSGVIAPGAPPSEPSGIVARPSEPELLRPQLRSTDAAATTDTTDDLAGDSKDPAVIVAALDAVQARYVSQAARHEPFDEALDRTLQNRLRSAHPAVVAKALSVATVPLIAGSPGEKLVRAVSELAEPDQAPERRQAALQTLNSIRPSERSSEWFQLFETALRAREPQVVTTALEMLLLSPRAWQNRTDLRRRWVPIVSGLVTHADPGVRGRALALLGLLDPAGAGTRALARRALRDSYPYVRAVGCDVLERTGEAAYIHDVIPLLSDPSVATYDLTGWTRLDGGPGHEEHVLPGRRLVAEAALHAVQTLAGGAVLLPFGGPEGSAAQLADSIRRAQEWYTSERARLPAPLP